MKLLAQARKFAPMVALILLGCQRSEPAPDSTGGASAHQHRAQHGGTAVALGDEAFHLEFVLDPADGKLQAYVMDGELENFVRLPADSIELTVVGSHEHPKLPLAAVANAATGEKVGDTALFEARADWLKSATNFDAVIEQISVRGQTYRQVQFNFPKGNDTGKK